MGNSLNLGQTGMDIGKHDAAFFIDADLSSSDFCSVYSGTVGRSAVGDSYLAASDPNNGMPAANHLLVIEIAQIYVRKDALAGGLGTDQVDALA